MINLLNNIWAVKVSEDSFDFTFEWSKTMEKFILTYKSPYIWEKYKKKMWDWECFFDKAPNILFLTGAATEEDWLKVLFYERHPMQDYILGWMDYALDYKNIELDDWRQSSASLLRSHNLNGRYLIIEKMD